MKRRGFIPLVLAGLLATSECARPSKASFALPDSTRAALLTYERSHDYFRLRDHLNDLGQVNDAWGLFFRAVVANGFGHEAESDSILDRLTRQQRTVPDSLQLRAAQLRYQNDIRIYRYADALSDAKAVMALPLADSATRTDMANEARLFEALRDVPPQTVETREGGDLHPDKHGRVIVTVDSTQRRYAFDSGANLSVLMRSEAERLGLEIRPVGVVVGGASNLQVQADVAVASRVEVGGATLRHVVFLVLPDSALTFPGLRITGLLGFPVQRALGAMAYQKDGTLRVLADTNPRVRSTLALHKYTPFISVTVHADTLSCQLDTGSGNTVLYEPFYQSHRAWIDSIGQPDTLTEGGVGGTRRLPVVTLPATTLSIAGVPVSLDDIEVRTTLPSWQDKHLMCLIGRDALTEFREYVIDYHNMVLELR